MINRRLYPLVAIFLLVICLPGCLFAESSDKQKRMDAISREMAKVRNQEIVFFSKVVDFTGTPVAEAQVRMRVRVFGARSPQSAFQELHATTDKDGLFSVVGFGELINLLDISRDGYVYHFEYNRERSRWTSKSEQAKGLGFTSEKPMVFRMRKMEPPSFVLTGSMDFALRADSSKLLDLYRREWVRPDDVRAYKMTRPDWKADIKVSVEENGQDFQVILETLEPDSGFVEDTPEFFEEMTEAPEHGYRPKHVIPLKRGGGGHLFAYVKNSGGLFHSKLSVGYTNNVERDYVELRFGYTTNMEGGERYGIFG